MIDSKNYKYNSKLNDDSLEEDDDDLKITFYDDDYDDNEDEDYYDNFNEKDDDEDEVDSISLRSSYQRNVYGATNTTNTNSSNNQKPKRQNIKRVIVKEILSYIKILVVAALIALIITRFVIINAQVPTGSMENTINVGDRLIGFRLAYLFSEPQLGDIIIFKYPDNEEENYVKRVIGTPGDVVEITGGKVYVNGVELEEDYIKEAMIDDGTSQVYYVPEDCYFVLGDNRNNSWDSRKWTNTFVSKDKILAKVIFKYYDGENSKLTFSLFNN